LAQKKIDPKTGRSQNPAEVGGLHQFDIEKKVMKMYKRNSDMNILGQSHGRLIEQPV
jgi:hypothetical protein